jgi:hypothetical protein
MVGKPAERRRCRAGDNVKMTLQDVEWEDVDWIYLAEDSE